MAVRFDGNSEHLTQATAVTRFDYNAAYTMMLWYYPVSINATVNIGFLWAVDTGVTRYDSVGQMASLYGSDLFYQDNVSGYVETGSAITAGTWYHITLVRYSATLMRLFQNGVQVGTDRTGNVAGRAAADKIAIGNVTGTVYIPARFAHAKMWRRGLSPEEIRREMWTVTPQTNLRDVVGWWPLMAENRAADYSGLELPWTENGTLSNEADPGIAWTVAKPRPMFWYVPPPTGTTYTQSLIAFMAPVTYDDPVSVPATLWPTKRTARTLAAGLSPTGALTYLKALLRTITASLTPTASLLKRTSRTLAASLTPTANLLKRTSRTLAASLTPTASLLKRTSRTLAASLTPTANLLKRTSRTLTASLTPTANLLKRTARTLTASLTPTTTLSALLSTIGPYLLLLTASLTPTASLLKRTARTLTASLTPLASLLRSLIGTLGGRARCTLTIQAPNRANLALQDANSASLTLFAGTTCGLETSEV